MTATYLFSTRSGKRAFGSFIAGFLVLTFLGAQSNYRYEATRLPGGQPAISQQMFRDAGVGQEGENMNGPSVIRLPDWIAPENRAHPEAQYYLYFAHHDGGYIRMAWAKEMDGPWHLYKIGNAVPLGQRGVMDFGGQDIHLDNGITIEFNHMASPDVHVDNENQRIIMYFHTGSSTFVDGKELKKQLTYVTESPYGLNFYDNIQPVILGTSYFRVFEYDGNMYSLTNDGTPFIAPDINAPWTPPAGFDFEKQLWSEHPGNPFQEDINADGYTKDELRVRHTAVRLVDDDLHVFYSRRGELVERIQWSLVQLKNRDWEQWDASYPPMEIIRPVPGWEGGELPEIPSETSAAPENVNQLRDPHVLEDLDGSLYLVYSGRGEDALGIAVLYYHEHIPAGIDMTDLEGTQIKTSNDEEPWISETEGAGSPPGEGPGQLIDNNNLTRYTVRATSSWIDILPERYSTVTGYTIAFASEYPSRDPKVWEFLGWDDILGEWVSLHAYINYPVRQQKYLKKSWILDADKVFSKYRLNIHSINDDPNGIMQLAELEVFAEPGDSIPGTNNNTYAFESNETMSFTTYPNPGNGLFHIFNPSGKEFSYKVVSMNGRVLFEKEHLINQTEQVDLQHLSAGMYLLYISNASRKEVQRIIIQ